MRALLNHLSTETSFVVIVIVLLAFGKAKKLPDPAGHTVTLETYVLPTDIACYSVLYM